MGKLSYAGTVPNGCRAGFSLLGGDSPEVCFKCFVPALCSLCRHSAQSRLRAALQAGTCGISTVRHSAQSRLKPALQAGAYRINIVRAALQGCATLSLFLLFLFVALPLAAQNVYISPEKGSLIAANTEGLNYNEVGADLGLRGLWRHNQLPLTLVAADLPTLNSSGELGIPAGNMKIVEQDKSTDSPYTDNSTPEKNKERRLVLYLGGGGYYGHFSISLPYGFYITGYRMVLLNNIHPKAGDTKARFAEDNEYSYTYEDIPYHDNAEHTIFETDSTFNIYNSKTEVTIPGGRDLSDNADYDIRQEYVLERTSTQMGRDIGNHLYFRCVNENYKTSLTYARRKVVTVKSCVIYFTAQGETTIEMRPKRMVSSEESYQDEPFATGRVEMGDILVHKASHSFAFYSKDATALMGNNTIYEADAVVNGDVDRTSSTGERAITSTYNLGDESDKQKGYYFALSKNKTYYLETPVTTHNRTGGDLPLSYRITGVTAHMLYGKAHEEWTRDNIGVIWCLDGQGNKMYLRKNGLFTKNQSVAATWNFDNTNGICTIDGTEWLTYNERENSVFGDASATGKGLYLGTTQVKPQYNKVMCFSGNMGMTDVPAILHNIPDDSGDTYWNLLAVDYETSVPYFDYTGGNKRYAHIEQSVVPAYNPQGFTLKIYDKTGTYVAKQASVSENAKYQELSLDGLNNDAVKIEISGLQEGTTPNNAALVWFELRVEALNPYLDRLRVNCSVPGGNQNVSQVFQVDDFEMQGGKIMVYVPEGYKKTDTDRYSITFDQAYNQYSDAAYYGGVNDGHARYSLVKSQYYNATPSLYTGYDISADFTGKIATSLVAMKPYKISNVEELLQEVIDGTGTATRKHFQEWHFDMQRYSDDGGSFAPVLVEEHEAKDIWIFSMDETKYNIAPTTATQHRMHAYYHTQLTVVEKNFTQQHEWVKLYDDTFSDRETGEGTQKWGLYVRTKEQVDGQYGYLDFDNARNQIIQEVGTDDTRFPHSSRDILFIDTSDLTNILYEGTDQSNGLNSLQQMRRNIAPNGIIFLPLGMSMKAENSENFARKVDKNYFRSVMDITLTDKKPFFSPYDIQLPAASKVRYERKITAPQNGKVSRATVIMPFQIDIDQEGRHTNPRDGGSISLHQMQQENCLSVTDAGEWRTYFDHLSQTDNILSTKANTPYFVQVETAPRGNASSFSIEQQGALLKASLWATTPASAAISVNDTDWDATASLPYASATRAGSAAQAEYEGETGTGRYGQHESVTFQNEGTFSGITIPKGEQVFYFAQDRFYNSLTLDERNDNVLCYPFRAYFRTSGLTQGNTLSKMLPVIGFNDETTWIDGVQNGGVSEAKGQPFTVTTTDGGVEITALRGCHVRLASISGVAIGTLVLNPGESRFVRTGKGVYLVNNRKFTVH